MAGVYVMDSFAFLAYFFRETSAPKVTELIRNALAFESDLHIPAVNVGEVLYRLESSDGPLVAANALRIMRAWPLTIRTVDSGLAERAARVKATLRMGYLDCFVVALAQELDATVVTGDPDYRVAEHLVNILWLENNAPR